MRAWRSKLAAADPYVQMFIWFILRDGTPAPNLWYSGLEQASGQKKPSYAAFASTAAGIVGKTQVVRPGYPFSVTLAVPFMIDHDPPGTHVGVTYTIHVPRGILEGQPRVRLQTNESITFPVSFRPVKGQTYTMNVVVNDIHGQTERHVIELIPPTATSRRKPSAKAWRRRRRSKGAAPSVAGWPRRGSAQPAGSA